MTADRGFREGLSLGDKDFLARLSREIRERADAFELGGRYIDSRFSLLRSAPRMGERTGWRHPHSLKSPQDRLLDAMTWATRPSAREDLEECQAICILAWLLHDENAHLLQTVICELQMIPWKPESGHADGTANGARSLWGSRRAVAREALGPHLVRAARQCRERLSA